MWFRLTNVGLEGMGMVFGFGRRDTPERDEQRQGKVPYRLASYEHDVEGKRFKTSRVVYSFWSASKYVLVLSLMLWWLPMFGQMIAGYVGGRRAGGPWKGVVASILPVMCIWGIMTGFETGLLPSHFLGVAIAPAAMGAAVNSDIPFLAPYFQFSSEYVGGFVQGLAGSSPYGINYYVLTVAFAYVGGVLAAQNRREIEFTSGAVMNNTTVLVHDPNGYDEQPVAAQEGKPHGFFHGITALLHLPGSGHDQDVAVANARVGYKHKRDAWARASDIHYAEGADYGSPYAPPAEYSDFDETRSGGVMRSRPNQHYHHRQKRRGAPNMNSKPRFSYPQYTHSNRQDPGYRGGMIRRNKGYPQMQVSTDPKSIKKTQRYIDHEWDGHGRHNNYRAQDLDRGYEPTPRAPVETEAVALEHPRRREHESSSHQWDSI